MKRILSKTLGLFALVTALAGCSSPGGPFEFREYAAAADDVKEVRVDVIDREIAVSTTEDDEVRIGYYENDKEYYEVSLSDGVLSMDARSGKEWTDYVGVKTDESCRKIALAVPEKLLDSLALATTNEDISVSPLSTETASMSSNGGNIRFDLLDVGESLSLRVKNGNIDGSLAGAEEDFAVSCDTKKGKCNLQDDPSGEKSLDVSANNGDVNIEFAG